MTTIDQIYFGLSIPRYLGNDIIQFEGEIGYKSFVDRHGMKLWSAVKFGDNENHSVYVRIRFKVARASGKCIARRKIWQNVVAWVGWSNISAKIRSLLADVMKFVNGTSLTKIPGTLSLKEWYWAE